MQLERYCLTWWCAPAQYMLLASLVLINIIIAVLLDGASAFENNVALYKLVLVMELVAAFWCGEVVRSGCATSNLPLQIK